MPYFYRTVFLGHDLALFLPNPDWNSAVNITYRLASSKETGQTGRENRFPKHYALRHELAAAWVLSRSVAAGFQEQLYYLGTPTTEENRVYVGTPLFMDRLPRERWGERIHNSEWVINYDASGYQLMPVAEVPASPAYAWLAPLLVGRLAKRPKIKALTDVDASFTMEIYERSPWDFRIMPMPEGDTSGDWPAGIPLNWSKRPTDTTDDGLEYSNIGEGRVEAVDGQEMAVRRAEEFTAHPRTKAQIRTLINFFAARQGRLQSFTAPWLLRPGADTTATPHSTRATFAEDAIKLEYRTDIEAKATIGLIQVPWEVAGVEGETPVQAAVAYFFRFFLDVPGTPAWRFTNWERDLAGRPEGTYLGDTKALVQFDRITRSTDMSDDAVTLTSYAFADNPLLLVERRQLDVPLHFEIYKGTPDAPASALLIYEGEIDKVTGEDRLLTATTLLLGGQLDTKVPNFYYTPTCQYMLCGDGCNCDGSMPEEHWTFSGTITAISGTAIDVAITGNPPGADLVDEYFESGFFQTGTALDYELKLIVRSEKLSETAQRFTLKKELRAAEIGSAFTAMPYCNGTVAECEKKYANYINFGGHPHMGSQNISLPSQQTSTGGAGKK